MNPTETHTMTSPTYPAETPLGEMTAEQQAAYWKKQARKHENAVKARADYDQLVQERDRLRAASTNTDAEMIADPEVVAAARIEGEAQGRRQASHAAVWALIDALAGPERAAILKEGLNPDAFLVDGLINTAALTSFIR